MKEKYLVTGANGFIGSHLVDALVSKRRFVKVLIRENSNIYNIEEHVKKKRIEIVYGDMRERRSLKEALDNCNVICNVGALTDLSASRKAFLDVNVHSLRNMLDLASKRPVKRFVQISSIGAFSKNHSVINEETPLNPMNNYELSKVEGEKIAISYWKEKGLPVTILEPSAVYGPKVNIGFPYMLDAIKKGRMRYPVSEDNLLNLIYVTDFVKAIELSIEKEEAIGERFIIGGEKPYTYKEIIEAAAHELGVPPPKKHIPISIAKCFIFITQHIAKMKGKKPGLVIEYFDYITTNMNLDISKAKSILGFKPEVELKDGMREMVKWFLSSRTL